VADRSVSEGGSDRRNINKSVEEVVIWRIVCPLFTDLSLCIVLYCTVLLQHVRSIALCTTVLYYFTALGRDAARHSRLCWQCADTNAYSGCHSCSSCLS